MPAAPGQQWTPVVITGALMATAVAASAIRGSAEAAVAAVLVGTLIIAHFVRRRVRTRLLYDRLDDAPAREPSPSEPPEPAATRGRSG